jgi:hypothetical protein
LWEPWRRGRAVSAGRFQETGSGKVLFESNRFHRGILHNEVTLISGYDLS